MNLLTPETIEAYRLAFAPFWSTYVLSSGFITILILLLILLWIVWPQAQKTTALEPRGDTMKSPFVEIPGKTLDGLPLIKEGDNVFCVQCQRSHTLKCIPVDDGSNQPSILMVYQCGDRTFIGAINNRLIVASIPADVAGETNGDGHV